MDVSPEGHVWDRAGRGSIRAIAAMILRRPMSLLSKFIGIVFELSRMPCLHPASEQSVSRDGLDLLAIAAMVEGEHRIMGLV
jgi:hypothetical protein